MGEGSGRLRLDLFLSRSRLVKRRPLAALLCQEGHVTVNGRETGPGKGVKPGDRVAVRFAREVVTVEVVSLPERRHREGEGYRILGREPVEET